MPLNLKSRSPDETPTPPAGDDPQAEKAKDGRPKPRFMMRGAAAKKEFERAKTRQKERQERAGSMRRFWMKTGEERNIIFLDGVLDDEGMLDVDYFYEHTVPYENRFENIKCTQKNETDLSEACPLCEQGDEPAYVGIFTIIEMLDEPWKDSKGVEHNYARRLYPAKIQTLQQLQIKATKLSERQNTNGLAGCRFEVSRSGDRRARVGDDFEFVESFTHKELVEALEEKGHADPADYYEEPELMWRTAEEILEMGLGGKSRTVGKKTAPGNSAARHL